MSPLPRTVSGEPSFPLACTKVEKALLDLQEEYGLTELEMLQILNRHARSILGYMVRGEQRKNPERKTEP